jgi:hypothetical protein
MMMQHLKRGKEGIVSNKENEELESSGELRLSRVNLTRDYDHLYLISVADTYSQN